MCKTIQQTHLDFQLEATSETLTSKSGLAIIQETALTLGVVADIKALLPLPGSNRGYQPDEYVMPLTLMLCGGGRSLEDLREIRADRGLRKLCGLERVPSSDATGTWLRQPGLCRRLKLVNRELTKKLIRQSKTDDLTLDIDATYIETEKQSAKTNYEGERSFSVLLGFIAELDLCVASRYRNGNISPVEGIKEELVDSIKLAREAGKRIAYFRSDSAAYTADIINCCQDAKVTFAITADQNCAVKELIEAIPEDKWLRLYDECGKQLRYTGRHYATTIHSMSATRAFTLIIQRWPNPKADLFEDSEPYCYHVVATDDPRAEGLRTVPEVIWHHNQRSNAENYNKEIKAGFGMEYVPSRLLRADAAYFEIGVLAYNLTIAVKRLLLDESWLRKTIATLRWQMIFIAGKVIEHGRQLILRIARQYLELLQGMRERLRTARLEV
jgi:hypothetical protein